MSRVSLGSRYQKAFSLVELMIAVVIGVFLLASVMTVFFTTRQTSIVQRELALLQDNQRLAMTLITDVVQEAGYFHNLDPLHLTTVTAALPALAPFAGAGQAVYGEVGDTISVRFQSKQGDGIIHCLGGKNEAAGTTVTYINTFRIHANKLLCAVSKDGVAANEQPLIDGIQSMTITYGVDTDADEFHSADRYLSASAMTAANWLNVISVKVTLNFINPLANQAGQEDHLTIPLTRVINVMSKS